MLVTRTSSLVFKGGPLVYKGGTLEIKGSAGDLGKISKSENFRKYSKVPPLGARVETREKKKTATVNGQRRTGREELLILFHFLPLTVDRRRIFFLFSLVYTGAHRSGTLKKIGNVHEFEILPKSPVLP